MCQTFGMVNTAIGAFIHVLRCGTGLLFLLMAGLLWLIVAGDLLGPIKQLEALPYDNDDQGGKDDFRKAQHV